MTDNNLDSALTHLRVLEIGEMPAAYSSSFLAGLGANVIKVEPPGGDPNRLLPPFANDIEDKERGIPFLNANLNKRSIVIDLSVEKEKTTFRKLIQKTDILIESTPPGYLDSIDLGQDSLKKLNPELVTVSLTPFGQSGPYSHFAANDAVVSAMSGAMMSQGDDTRAPVVIPCQLSYQIAAIHGAYLALAAIRHRRKTGYGQRIDLSLQEALTYTAISAVARYSQRSEIVGRPGLSGGNASIYETQDGGFIQLAIFMTGHWRLLTRDWMDDPILSGDEWDSSQYRTDNEDLAQVLIQTFVQQFDRDEFVNEAQKRGIAVSPLNSFEDFVTNKHMRERDWFRSVTHPVIGEYEIPGPPVILKKTPWVKPVSAPLLNQHHDEILKELETERENTSPKQKKTGDMNAPLLEGIRVADITRAFAGPIGTMFLGFYGAEVIKVESNSLEANRDPDRPLFPDMNRAKLSVTLDLRNDEGKGLFKKIVAESDLVVDNFSASVMKRLGLNYDELVKINPSIIQIGMPGMGTTGPLNSWVTYGNNLQSFTGLSMLWGHPESPMQAHAKGVLPDYVGAGMVALSSIAALEYRDRTGIGQQIEICQIDGQGALMGPAILDYTINDRSWGSIGYEEPLAANISPFGSYPCKYEDTWILIACEKEEEWMSLANCIGSPELVSDKRFSNRDSRTKNKEALDKLISDWTKSFTPNQALFMLQNNKIPSGITLNGEGLHQDIHLRERNHIVKADHSPWGELEHQGLPGIPELSLASAAKKAPWIGDDNDYVLSKVIGLKEEEIKEGKAKGYIN